MCNALVAAGTKPVARIRLLREQLALEFFDNCTAHETTPALQFPHGPELERSGQ